MTLVETWERRLGRVFLLRWVTVTMCLALLVFPLLGPEPAALAAALFLGGVSLLPSVSPALPLDLATIEVITAVRLLPIICVLLFDECFDC